MLATLIPVFDAKMDVDGYAIFAQRENYLVDTLHGGSLKNDNITETVGFDIVDSVGLDTLASDREVFIPISNVALFTDLDSQCEAPNDKVILLLDNTVEPIHLYQDRLLELRQQGFRLAFSKIPITKLGAYGPILSRSDTIFLDPHKVDIRTTKALFDRAFPHLRLCATRVDSQKDYDILKSYGGFDLYEGNFFRLPANSPDKTLAPMKVTYLELLKTVNQDDYDLTQAADVIGQDPALVVSLLGIVNRMTINSGISSVRHAAAMLGQKELKRWINTAVTKELCQDKPSEITRLSMLRARFAENLAPLFQMGGLSDELFLMGLFSVLDIMLDMPIEDAIKKVNVSPMITNALLYGKGELARVYEFMLAYENASWQVVSRTLLLEELNMDDVYIAYLESLRWYRDLVSIRR